MYLNVLFSSINCFTISYDEKILSLQNVIICIKSDTSKSNLAICSDSRITSIMYESKFRWYLFVSGCLIIKGEANANRTYQIIYVHILCIKIHHNLLLLYDDCTYNFWTIVPRFMIYHFIMYKDSDQGIVNSNASLHMIVSNHSSALFVYFHRSFDTPEKLSNP